MNLGELVDLEQALGALRLLFAEKQVVELRVLGAVTPSYRPPHTESGYFTDFRKLVEAAAKIREAKGVYITLNSVEPALLARADNRLRALRGGDHATSDHEVARRCWLLVDIDPVRPSGISATRQERRGGVRVAGRIRRLLHQQGLAEPVVIDSGNGVHLLYPIDLPPEDQGLVKNVLEALAFRFDTAEARVDTSVHNPARIVKLPGTLAMKGDSAEERPHRRSRVLVAPPRDRVVTEDQLRKIAAWLPEPPPTTASTRPDRNGHGPFDLESFIRQHLDVDGPTPWQGGQRWVFPVCPFNSEHRDRSAYLLQFPSGAIAAGCHHNGCQGRSWKDLRALYEPNSGAFVSSVSAPPGVSPEFGDPQPLPDELPPVLPFDLELLPDTLRPWIRDIADRMQCPPDFLAVTAMVVLATVVGRRVGIWPKREDDWLVVPNLWGLVCARPSLLKTPALAEALNALRVLEIDAKEVFEEAQKEHAKKALVAEERKKVARDAIRKALKDKEDPEKHAEEALSEDLDEPRRARFIVNDSTVEKLGEILRDSPNGVLVFRDELIGFLRGLDKEGHESARAFYLEAWAGTGRFTYDRIGRGTIDIEAACVSIFGGITPGALGPYLRVAVQGGTGDDGFLQRLQLAVWPDAPPNFVNVDRPPDREARARAYVLIRDLAHLTPEMAGAEVVEPGEIPALRFDGAAQDLFDEWRETLENRLRAGADHPAIESHLGKYRSLVPSLALLLHLADSGGGPVARQALVRAIGWAKYLESHARRIYAVAIQWEAVSARSLAQHLQRGDLESGFGLRDVYRRGWAGLSSTDEAAAAVELLVELNWLLVTQEETGGRPRRRHWIHPQILGNPTEATDKTDKSPPADPFVSFVSPDSGDSEDVAPTADGPTWTLSPDDPDVGRV